jgi:prepilin-type N-terminal cleavage/methylation domain-containing protein
MTKKPSPQMHKEPSTTKRRGFSLVEVMLAVSIFSLIAISFSSSFIYGIESVTSAGARTRASMIALEGIEATRSIRDNDFAGLSAGSHGITLSNGKWILSGSEDVIDGFTRTITISDIDSTRKNIVSEVIWQQGPRDGSVSLATRLTDWNSIVPEGTVMVHKIVINTLGTKTADDFAPYTIGETAVTLDTAVPFPPGTYTVSEVTDPLYTTTFSGDCDENGSITIDYEEEKTCTITNQEI